MKEILEKRLEELQQERDTIESTQRALFEALEVSQKRMVEVKAIINELQNLTLSPASQEHSLSLETHSFAAPSEGQPST